MTQPYPPDQPYPADPAHQPPPPNRRPLWIGLGVLAAVVVLGAVAVTGFVAPGFFLSDAAPAPAAPQAQPSQGEPGQSPSSEAASPVARMPMPKRSTPLPDPVSCEFPPDAKSSTAKKAAPPPPGPVPATGTGTVTVKTTAGELGLTLDRALAPCTVANFVSLARQEFYTGMSCHRLGIEPALQMLQCGDPGGTGAGGPGYTIPDELFPGLRYGRGVVAMAKTAEPNSGGSQFFLIFGYAQIPPEYTVFGSISDNGLRTLDKVAEAGVDSSTGPGDGTGTPNLPVTFQTVTVG